jgi:hypothetical protein
MRYPRAAEQLPQRNHVKHEGEWHEKRRHQRQGKTRRQLGRWSGLEDLSRARAGHDPQSHGDNQISHTE